MGPPPPPQVHFFKAPGLLRGPGAGLCHSWLWWLERRYLKARDQLLLTGPVTLLKSPKLALSRLPRLQISVTTQLQAVSKSQEAPSIGLQESTYKAVFSGSQKPIKWKVGGRGCCKREGPFCGCPDSKHPAEGLCLETHGT